MKILWYQHLSLLSYVKYFKRKETWVNWNEKLLLCEYKLGNNIDSIFYSAKIFNRCLVKLHKILSMVKQKNIYSYVYLSIVVYLKRNITVWVWLTCKMHAWLYLLHLSRCGVQDGLLSGCYHTWEWWGKLVDIRLYILFISYSFPSQHCSHNNRHHNGMCFSWPNALPGFKKQHSWNVRLTHCVCWESG